MKQLIAFVALCSLALSASAQEKRYSLPVSEVIEAQFHGESPAYRDWDHTRKFADERSKNEKIGYHPKGDWPLHEAVDPTALPQGDDPAWQKEKPLHIVPAGKAADVNFDGIGYTSVNPSDNILDVGPNHIIQMVNASSGAQFEIFDKSGNSLGAPVYFDNFFGFAGGLGDPIVLYDALVDRWFMAEFTSGSNDFNIAVSTTPDPTGTYFTYTFTAPNFPDYLKFGVWTDMYIMTSNESGPSAVYALDRNAMLAGSPASMQRFTVPDYPTIGFQATTPVTFDIGTAPPAGALGMFMRMADDAWDASITADRLEIWSMDIDFTNSANSVVSGPDFLPTDPFDTELCGYTAFACFQQPGTSTTLDPLREVLMNRVQYKNFGTHEAIVCNHVTDVDGTDRGGVRWYELRRNGGVSNPWSIYQQGTYSPDTDSRFMAGIAINEVGDISLFYNVTSSSTFPSLRYTGRYSNDPLGQMTLAEVSIVEGSASNASNRYGDYNSLDVDPADGISFWGTGNYNPSSSWATRIAGYSFSALDCTAPTVAHSITENCEAGTYDLTVDIGADGDTTFYNVEVRSATDTAYFSSVVPGDLAAGTFDIGELVDILVLYPGDAACNRTISSVGGDGTSCCIAPTLSVVTDPDCTNEVFSIDLTIGADGDASDYDVYSISGGLETFEGTFAAGTYVFGDYSLGVVVDFRVEHNGFDYCDQELLGVTESAICNDECSGALPIVCGGTVSGTTVGATVESPDPGLCGTTAGTGGGVWYRFTGQNSNSPLAAAGTTGDLVLLSTCNDGGQTGGSSDYDTKLRVYSGDCGTLTCVAGNDDFNTQCSGLSSLVEFSTVVGTEYFVLVHGYNSNEGNYVLSMDCTAPPACADPSGLTAVALSESVTISWTENGGSSSWDIEYGPLGFTQGTGTVVPGVGATTYNITGLDSDTAYDFYVRSNCPNGVDNSGWVLGSFTTLADYCSGDLFTDSGGESGSYGNAELATYVICPDSPGQNVSLTFTFVDIEVNTTSAGIQDGCWDFLTVYDGADTSSPVLAETLCGELEVSGQVPSDTTSLLQAGDVFTATSGCLTVVFDSDGSVVNQGWAATVDCGAPVDPCEVFDTAPVDLTKSQQPVPFPDGDIDRVQLKFYKASPQVKYTAADDAALDIEFWPIRDLATNTPINDGDTSLIADRVKPGQEFFKWPVKFIRPDIQPNTRYRWRVRTKCQAGDLRISPWSEEKVFNTPDFDPVTGIYTPPSAIAGGQGSGVKLLSEGADLALFPNPNDGRGVNLNIGENAWSGMVYIQVLDLSGKLVHAELLSIAKGDQSLYISFDTRLSRGAYTLSLGHDTEILHSRFVVE